MRTLLLLALLPCVTIAFAAEKTTVAEVLKDPAKYEGKAVAINAKAFKIERKISRIKNDYYTFRIGTEKEYLNVYGKDDLDLAVKEGDVVTVTGIYKQARTYKDTVYKNEIDCTKKLGAGFGISKH